MLSRYTAGAVPHAAAHAGLWLIHCLMGFQVASAHAELSQKVLLTPTAPTSLNASLALGSVGIMVCTASCSRVMGCIDPCMLSRGLS